MDVCAAYALRGVLWWDGLSEGARLFWRAAAGTDVPREVWNYFNLCGEA
jgi:hypothetical protein